MDGIDSTHRLSVMLSKGVEMERMVPFIFVQRREEREGRKREWWQQLSETLVRIYGVTKMSHVCVMCGHTDAYEPVCFESLV